MKPYRDLYWQSQDRLRLYARMYDGPDPAAPSVLCLPGLRRNSRDFEELAPHLQTRFRVIAPDLRGRGLSARDRHVTSYQPNVYVHDILRLLGELQRPRVVVIGTGLGGLLGMMLARVQPALVSGLILNDVGPAVDTVGAARMLRLLAERPSPKDWVEATQYLKGIYAVAWPDLSAERWAVLTRRLFREDAYGRIAIDCDPMVVDVTRQWPATSTDLWPLWRELGNLPLLAIRGALSDVLSAEILAQMAAEYPHLQQVTVENRGHFPLLDETPALGAIDAFCAQLHA